MRTLFLNWVQAGEMLIASDPIKLHKRWVIKSRSGGSRFKYELKAFTHPYQGPENSSSCDIDNDKLKLVWRAVSMCLSEIVKIVYKESMCVSQDEYMKAVDILNQMTELPIDST